MTSHSIPYTISMKNFFILNMDGGVKYLFSHYNEPCLSPYTTTGCVPKNNNFSKQPVLTCGFVELWHVFSYPFSIRPLAAVRCETYWFVARILFKYSCPMIHWPRVHCGATTHYPENSIFVLNLCTNPQEDNIHYPPQHPLEDSIHHPCWVRYPTLDNPVTVDQPWHSQAANGYDGLVMPPTI